MVTYKHEIIMIMGHDSLSNNLLIPSLKSLEMKQQKYHTVKNGIW